jgi:CNT family concentrative nucleoside transporter
MAVGASDGLKLALNIAGMLLAFIAVIAMLNYFLTDMVGEWTGLNAWVQQTTGNTFRGFSLEYILGQGSGCWPGSSGWSGKTPCRWAACWARRR